MIYRPKEAWLWDCWIVPFQNSYYLFHLSITPDMVGKSGWNGISLAISTDLVHWKEKGEILHKSEEAVWIGTGMVQKIGDDFIMNYSEECPKGSQVVKFAKSKDLFHWEKINDVTFKPDGINYMNDSHDLSQPYPRFDSLGIVDALEDKEPPYYAFMTASAKNVKHMNKNGGLGCATSNDGLHWSCLPNAFLDTDMFPQFEVPEHFEISGRHYVIFCTSTFLSHRFDKLAEGFSGGTFYVTGDKLTGPYRLPDGDYMLHGTRNNIAVSTVTVGRPLKVNNEIYYYHIWADRTYNGAVGTVKLIKEVKPYELKLIYNHINDCLYGPILGNIQDFQHFTFMKNEGLNPPAIIKSEPNRLVFENLGTAAAIDFDELKGNKDVEYDDLSNGRIVEIEANIKNGCLGFYFKSTNGNERYCVALNLDRQRIEFGNVVNGWGPNVVITDELKKNIKLENHVNVRLFVRLHYFELYINDDYISSWVPSGDINPNECGLYLEELEGEIRHLRVTQMN